MSQDTKPNLSNVQYVKIPIIPVDPEIDRKIDEYFSLPKVNPKKERIRELNKLVAKWGRNG